MDILIATIFTIGLCIASVSFFVIRAAARRPANGELKRLAAIERKIEGNQQLIINSLRHCNLQPLI